MSYSSFIQTITGQASRWLSFIINIVSDLMSNYFFKTLVYICLLGFIFGIITLVINIFKVKSNPKNLEYKDD